VPVPSRSISNTGLTLAVLSGATFGTSGSFASSLLSAGWSPGAAVTARIIIAALVLTPPALLRLRSTRPTARGLRSVVLYGIFAVAAAQLCYFNAVQHLSVAVALLLEYSGILLVIMWMWARHGHRPRRLTLTGGAVALAGLVLVLDLAGAQHVDLVGVCWGLGAAVGLAVYFVISASADDGLPPIVVAWGGLAVGAVVLGGAILAGALPVHVTRTDVTLLSHRVSWIVPILGMSLIAAAIAYVTGIAAARLLGAKVASFVGLTEVLFAVGFAWLLLGQSLDVAQAVGAALVVGGIALVRLDELRSPVSLQARSTQELLGPPCADPRPPSMIQKCPSKQHQESSGRGSVVTFEPR
jgi:drug/metabolite transporter (DMT)-like permease